jgi:ubiquinol-cytochrome c reductase cytochrome b subunit
MRQVHHWSAVTFVAAILIHMARIFFTAAFRKPRELNWVVGVTMLILASLTGFTGYSLPERRALGHRPAHRRFGLLAMPFVGRVGLRRVHRRRLSGTAPPLSTSTRSTSTSCR